MINNAKALISTHRAMPHRPTACRTLSVQARLFKITRLHSHEPSVLIDTESASTTSQAEQLASPAATTNSTADMGTPTPPSSPSAKGAATGRKLFYPTARSLKYLDGSLPGDYGFDPLGLADPGCQGQPGEGSVMNLNWLSYAELVHGRWAMVAAAGAVAPELLAMLGVIPPQTGLPWFEAGGLFSQTQGGIQGIPFLGDIPFTFWTDKITLMFTMLVAMSFAELRRLQDYHHPGSMGKQYFLGLEAVMHGSGDPKYPGGQFFNLANLGGSTDSPEMLTMRVKEVKNGRLAMVAWLGFMVQACTTHQGPVRNFLDHIAYPFDNNIVARIGDFALTASPAQQLPFILYLAAGVAAAALYNYAAGSSVGGTSDTLTSDDAASS